MYMVSEVGYGIQSWQKFNYNRQKTLCKLNNKEHDVRLSAVLNRIQEAGVTLNKGKYEFEKTKLTFLEHLIDQYGRMEANRIKVYVRDREALSANCTSDSVSMTSLPATSLD